MTKITQGREASEDTAKRKAEWPKKRQAREDKKQARLQRLRNAATVTELAAWVEDELA